jgi:AraC family transcriptional regulator
VKIKLHEKIIIDAINYIKEHIEENLTVDDVAKHCNYSKYYFSRIFKLKVGESVYKFIKRMKIEKSILDLIVQDKKSITEISANYGYSSSNYSAVFAKHYSKSPSKYKKYFVESKIKSRKGLFADLSNIDFDFFDDFMEPKVLNDIEVIYERFIGDYRKLQDYWKIFFERNGVYYDENSLRIEISYNDPFITDPDKCITDICITTSKSIDDNYNKQIIKGGKYMVYHFEGSYNDIFEMFQGIMGIWIPQSKLKFDLKNRKIFNMFEFVDVSNDFYIFDVHIPYC